MVDWEDIVSREGPGTWRSIYRLVGNRADADECLQETFVDAVKSSRRGPVENWAGLLRRLGTARAVDRLRERSRRRHRERASELRAAAAREAPPDQRAEADELSEVLCQAISTLPPKQSQAFCLHTFEQWSYQEVARELTVTPDAVGVLLHRARARLRERLARSTALASAGGTGRGAGGAS